MSIEQELLDIKSAPTVQALRKLRADAFNRHGFPMVYYQGPITMDRSFGRILLNFGMPLDWQERYQNHFFQHDPIPEYGLRVKRAFRWSEVEAKAELGRGEKSYFEWLRGFGFDDGASLPMIGHGGRTGMVGLPFVGTRKSASDDELWIMQCVHQAAFNRFCELIADAEAPVALLSRREVEVVYWIAQGKSNSSIATILEISTETVDSYVRRIFKKLNVADRTSAALSAMLLGYVFKGSFVVEPDEDE